MAKEEKAGAEAMEGVKVEGAEPKKEDGAAASTTPAAAEPAAAATPNGGANAPPGAGDKKADAGGAPAAAATPAGEKEKGAKEGKEAKPSGGGAKSKSSSKKQSEAKKAAAAAAAVVPGFAPKDLVNLPRALVDACSGDSGVLQPRQLFDLADKAIDGGEASNIQLDGAAWGLLSGVAEHLAMSTLQFAVKLVDHRGGSTIEPRDMARYLRTNMHLDIHAPDMEDVRPTHALKRRDVDHWERLQAAKRGPGASTNTNTNTNGSGSGNGAAGAADPTPP